MMMHFKRFVGLISILAVVLLAAGCQSADNTHSNTNNKPDNTTHEVVEHEQKTEQEQVVYGSIEITDEIRGEFFDLAREQRWDFLPWFKLGEPPTDLDDYIDWVMIQAQVWAGYDNPDRELTPSTLSKEYVSELISKRFNVDVPMPVSAGSVDRFAFDGNNFTVQIGGWANLPAYELTELSVDNLNDQDVYTAKLLQYNHVEGLTEIERDTIISGNADKSNVYAFCWLEVQFYVNGTSNEIVFLSVNGGTLY